MPERQALPGVLADAGYPGADPVDQLVRLVLGDLDEVVLEVTAFGGEQGRAALPHEIDALKREGFGFVTIPQLLGLKLIYR